jgi:hypothetical protein
LTEAIHFGNDQHPSVAALRPLDAFPPESVDAFNRNHWRLSPEYAAYLILFRKWVNEQYGDLGNKGHPRAKA